MRDVGKMTHPHCFLRQRLGCRAQQRQSTQRPERNTDQCSTHAVVHCPRTPSRSFKFLLFKDSAAGHASSANVEGQILVPPARYPILPNKNPAGERRGFANRTDRRFRSPFSGPWRRGKPLFCWL